MATRPFVRSAARLAATATAVSAAAYMALVTTAWRRYGNPPAQTPDKQDDLLDQFMPAYDVVERHEIAVAAPPAVVLSAAKEQDLLRLPIVRAIFRARELALGASPDERVQPPGLLATVRSLGWGVLAEREGREIVVGAVTKPWEANVTFRALPPEQFAAYNDPGFVKIAWTLRADPLGEHGALFRTETRALGTDADARDRFRTYWAFVSPGIAAIRRLSLRPLKRAAEARARELDSER